jgi:hypothetical protein
VKQPQNLATDPAAKAYATAAAEAFIDSLEAKKENGTYDGQDASSSAERPSVGFFQHPSIVYRDV